MRQPYHPQQRHLQQRYAQQRHPMPTRCPVTGQPLEVTRLECPQSGVVIEGQFKPNEFASLRMEHLEFLRLFLRVRGNLKEVERLLGVSYPTVRLRFDEVIKALGYEDDVPEANTIRTQRAEILTQLENGEIDAGEAAKQLRALKK